MAFMLLPQSVGFVAVYFFHGKFLNLTIGSLVNPRDLFQRSPGN